MSETTVTKSVPRIRTKRITAANLLRRIRALVLEEPARLNMDSYISAFRGRIRSSVYDPPHVGDLPACGTVGCIAGWGAMLLRRPDEIPRASTAETTMVKLLGHPEDDPWFSSYYTDHDLFSDYGADIDGTRPGTKAHARAVAQRIDSYLEEHPDLETRVIDVERKRIVKGDGVQRNR
jgi:hypothetical protein